MICQSPPPSRKLISERGMSLIEMMVAVSIIAILAVIAVPGFQDMIVQSRLSSQTNELVSAIQAARGEAIKRNRQIDFCRAADAASLDCAGAGNWQFWIVRINNSDANRVLRRGSISPELRLTSTLNQGRVTFMPNGISNVTANNDTLTTCSPKGGGNTTRQITIGLAGRTTVAKSSGECS